MSVIGCVCVWGKDDWSDNDEYYKNDDDDVISMISRQIAPNYNRLHKRGEKAGGLDGLDYTKDKFKFWSDICSTIRHKYIVTLIKINHLT